jgi:hypothetical protein
MYIGILLAHPILHISRIRVKRIIEKYGGGYDTDHCLGLVNLVKSPLEFTASPEQLCFM